ncbi:AMP-binding protein, partial [Polynucleobacter yangtzensis]
ATIAFDAATFEIWGALLNGAKLALAPAGKLDLAEIHKAIQRYKVDVSFMTTAIFAEAIRTYPEIFENIKQFMFGGESVSPSSVKEMLSHFPDNELIHVYGPTETTTFALNWPLNHPKRQLESAQIFGTANLAIAPAIQVNTQLQTFNKIFAAQVARTPEAIALVYEEQSLTYAQLDARANQ